MGYNIGTRLVDEFIARSGSGRCHSFEETGELVGRAAFKMFLGCACGVGGWNADKTSFVLSLEDNPLSSFVDCPEEWRRLRYSGVLGGVIRGALHCMQMSCETEMLKDAASGDDTTEIRVTLKELLQDDAPPGDE